MDLALNNLLWLIFHKTKLNQSMTRAVPSYSVYCHTQDGRFGGGYWAYPSAEFTLAHSKTNQPRFNRIYNYKYDK